MIKNNLLGQILIALMVLFLLIGSIQMFGWGRKVAKIEIAQENLDGIPSVPKGKKSVDEKSKDVKKLITEITARPMFSSGRIPFVEENDEEVKDKDKNDDVVINELKVKLTGIVITPKQSYAMILDTLTNQRDTYKVGMPLEGEQGGWTLNSIQSRKVVFMSDDNKTQELELEVFGGSEASKGLGGSKNNKNKATPRQITRKDKKKNADDIRKKIAERRAQMRAEAAKQK